MRMKQGWLAALLVLAACGSDTTGPSPDARPLRNGGGLMGSGTRSDPPPPTIAPSDSTAR